MISREKASNLFRLAVLMLINPVSYTHLTLPTNSLHRLSCFFPHFPLAFFSTCR